MYCRKYLFLRADISLISHRNGRGKQNKNEKLSLMMMGGVRERLQKAIHTARGEEQELSGRALV